MRVNFRLRGQTASRLQRNWVKLRLRIFRRHVRIAEHRRHREKHPGQRPPHIGCANRARTQDSVVEIAPVVPHAIHGPVEHRTRQGNIAGVEILKLDKRNDALRDAMNIDGIRSVMEIPDGAVLPEKVGSIEIKTFSNTRIEFSCIGIPANRPQYA